MSEKLPLEILKEKYIPVEEFPTRYSISVPTIMRLIREKKIRPAEFKTPEATRRSLHANYEEVLSVLKEEIK